MRRSFTIFLLIASSSLTAYMECDPECVSCGGQAGLQSNSSLASPHSLTYYGGPVMSNCQPVSVLWGPHVNSTVAANMPTFLTDLVTSQWIDGISSDYSTTKVSPLPANPQLIGRGNSVPQYVITPSKCPGGAKCTVTDTQIQAEINAQIKAGHLPAPKVDKYGKANTLYVVDFPPGVTISAFGSKSCVGGGFCAYHGTGKTNSGVIYTYAVQPDFSTGGCTSGCGSGTMLQNQQSVHSHELAESVTDPYVGYSTTYSPPLAWYNPSYGEIGDYCQSAGQATVVLNGHTCTVQKIWSNSQGQCIAIIPNRAAPMFAQNSETPNQKQVSNQLVTLAYRPGLQTTFGQQVVFDALENLEATQQQLTLDQLSGLPYTYLLCNAEISTQKFVRRLFEPLRNLISPSFCQYEELPRNEFCFSPLTGWFEGSGTLLTVDGNSDASGFKSQGYEFTIGTQAPIGDCWTIGSAFCYEHETTDYRAHSHGNSNDFYGALYALYRPERFYLLGDLALGFRDERIKRTVDVNEVVYYTHGRPKTSQNALYIEGGFDWDLCYMLVQPFIGVDGGYYYHSGLKENGGGAVDLAVNSLGRWMADSRLGLHLTSQKLGCLVFAADLAWQYRFTNNENKSVERFRSFGSCFPIEGVSIERNSLDVTINVSTARYYGWSIYAMASGQLWRNARSYEFLGGIEKSW
ncbi:MAG: autotransporter outer membrane beta-barrel domain-containing protein [Parachlamydiaceae bacterium]